MCELFVRIYGGVAGGIDVAKQNRSIRRLLIHNLDDNTPPLIPLPVYPSIVRLSSSIHKRPRLGGAEGTHSNAPQGAGAGERGVGGVEADADAAQGGAG